MNWDWRYPIDFLRGELRKSRSDGMSHINFDDLEALIDRAESMYERLERDFPSDSEFRAQVESRKEVLTSLFDKSTQYVNVIVLGGYAALFSLWGFSKAQIPPWMSAGAGLLTLLSLTIYIGFELYVSWFRGSSIKNQLVELNAAEKLGDFPEEFGRAEFARASKISAKWPYFFFSAVAFALMAGVLLGFGFAEELVRTLLGAFSVPPISSP